MVCVVCPKCRNRQMMQDEKNLSNFSCSKCGKFVLLPVKPDSTDISAIWDYLIRAGKHLKEFESVR